MQGRNEGLEALGSVERFNCAITIILQVLSQGQIAPLASVVVMILLVLHPIVMDAMYPDGDPCLSVHLCVCFDIVNPGDFAID
jgi:hypothetical protein